MLKIWRGTAVCELQAGEREFVGKKKIPSKAVKRQHQLGLKPPRGEYGKTGILASKQLRSILEGQVQLE